MTSRTSRATRVPGARHWPLAALLLASVLWGGAITGTKYALRAFDPVTLLSVELAAATAALWAVLLIRGYRPPRSWLAAVLLGLLEPALAYLGETFGLSMTSATDGAVISGLESALVVMLAALVFLGEEPTRGGTIGACLIGGSVIYFTICHSRAIEPDLSPAAGPETLIYDARARN